MCFIYKFANFILKRDMIHVVDLYSNKSDE